MWLDIPAIILILEYKLIMLRIIHLHTADTDAVRSAGGLIALGCLTLLFGVRGWTPSPLQDICFETLQ